MEEAEATYETQNPAAHSLGAYYTHPDGCDAHIDPHFSGDKTPRIVSFTSNPARINRGESVTLSWHVENAENVKLWMSVPCNPCPRVIAESQPLQGTLTVTVPDEPYYVDGASFLLEAMSNDAPQLKQWLTVEVNCPFVALAGDKCPVTEDEVETTIQFFQRGMMLLREDTGESYILTREKIQGPFGPLEEPYYQVLHIDQPAVVVESCEVSPRGLFAAAEVFSETWNSPPFLEAPRRIRDVIDWATIESQTYISRWQKTFPQRYTTNFYLTLPDNTVISIGAFFSRAGSWTDQP